jgi:hypothetical protein
MAYRQDAAPTRAASTTNVIRVTARAVTSMVQSLA